MCVLIVVEHGKRPAAHLANIDASEEMVVGLTATVGCQDLRTSTSSVDISSGKVKGSQRPQSIDPFR